MSIKSRERQSVRLKAAGLTKPKTAKSNPKREAYVPTRLNVTALAEQSSKANRDSGRAERADVLGRRGAHGNGYLTHEQRTEASVRRNAVKQIAQLHNENKIPLKSTKKG